jgi:hypothetical protein
LKNRGPLGLAAIASKSQGAIFSYTGSLREDA